MDARRSPYAIGKIAVGVPFADRFVKACSPDVGLASEVGLTAELNGGLIYNRSNVFDPLILKLVEDTFSASWTFLSLTGRSNNAPRVVQSKRKRLATRGDSRFSN